MKTGKGFARRSVLTAVVACVACVASSAAAGAPIVCIDTNPTTKLLTRTMQVALNAGTPATVVVGTIAAIDATGLVTFHLPAGDQAVRPVSIAIEIPPPSMMAQMAIPQKDSLGPVHARIVLKDVSVKDGVILHPQCVAAQPEHEIAFVGTLRFDADAVVVDGEAFDYRAAETFHPGGARKPGA